MHRHGIPAGGGESPPLALGGDEVVELSRNQRLVITRASAELAPAVVGTPGEDCLRLIDARGVISLKIRLSPDGPVIEVGGGSVALKLEGDLAIGARRLLLHGSEGVEISSDADVSITAGENIASRAKRQDLTATLGDVRVYANDDVKIDGERIRMNC
jgi:hypothetical protein